MRNNYFINKLYVGNLKGLGRGVNVILEKSTYFINPTDPKPLYDDYKEVFGEYVCYPKEKAMPYQNEEALILKSEPIDKKYFTSEELENNTVSNMRLLKVFCDLNK